MSNLVGWLPVFKAYALNDPKITLNTTRSNTPHICPTLTAEPFSSYRPSCNKFAVNDPNINLNTVTSKTITYVLIYPIRSPPAGVHLAVTIPRFTVDGLGPMLKSCIILL